VSARGPRLFHWRNLSASCSGRGEQKEIRTFSLAPALRRRWRDLRRRLRAESTGERRAAAARTLGPTALEYGAATAAVFVLALALVHHRLTVGGFAALFGAVAQMQSAAFTLTYTLRDLRTGATDVGYVREFLALPGDPQRAGTAAFPVPLRDGLQIEGVSFTYRSRERPRPAQPGSPPAPGGAGGARRAQRRRQGHSVRSGQRCSGSAR